MAALRALEPLQGPSQENKKLSGTTIKNSDRTIIRKWNILDRKKVNAGSAARNLSGIRTIQIEALDG
jgi:hypothetical protein